MTSHEVIIRILKIGWEAEKDSTSAGKRMETKSENKSEVWTNQRRKRSDGGQIVAMSCFH